MDWYFSSSASIFNSSDSIDAQLPGRDIRNRHFSTAEHNLYIGMVNFWLCSGWKMKEDFNARIKLLTQYYMQNFRGVNVLVVDVWKSCTPAEYLVNGCFGGLLPHIAAATFRFSALLGAPYCPFFQYHYKMMNSVAGIHTTFCSTISWERLKGLGFFNIFTSSGNIARSSPTFCTSFYAL